MPHEQDAPGMAPQPNALASAEVGAGATGFATVSGAIGEATNYTRWVVEAALGPHCHGALLEVGVGYANYRPHLTGLSRYVGADIDRDVVEEARRKWPADKFHVVDMASDGFPDTVGKSSFDHVLCINALQYAPDERRSVANMTTALRSGGRLAVLLPAMPAIYGRMDELSGHRRRYSPGDVRALADGQPLANHRVVYMNPIGALGWAVNNLRAHQTLDDSSLSRQVTFFDRYVVPVSRILDPLTRRFWGLSLLWTAQRS